MKKDKVHNMKLYIRIGIVALFLVSCIVLGVVYAMQINERKEIQEIQAMRNTFLDDYNSNKQLVESYLQVYDIRDENSYQNIKNEMYNKLSNELQEQIFPTVNYEGLALHPLKTKVLSIKGTNNYYESENTFLLEYNLTGVNYNQDITNLVTVKNGTIMSVIRIK